MTTATNAIPPTEQLIAIIADIGLLTVLEVGAMSYEIILYIHVI